MAARRRRPNQLRNVMADLDRFVAQLMVALALEIVANLKASPSRGGTPVDTGWASANWVPVIGAITALTQTPAGRAARAAATAGARARQAAGEAALARYTVPREKITIGNPVPYVRKLNAGSSQQAPRMFVEAAIGRSVRAVVRAFGGRERGRRR